MHISESCLILIEPFLELNPWITIEVCWCVVCEGVAEGLLLLLCVFLGLGLDVSFSLFGKFTRIDHAKVGIVSSILILSRAKIEC